LVERRWNSSQAYSNSKLYVTALAFGVARHWPDVLSNAVDPGWVATKMGGASAPDDFDEGYLTQTGLPSAKIPRQLSAADIGITADHIPRPRKWRTQPFKTSSPPGSLK
jgi:NAD(P)-dependent dehydrogenase (short-subunit alcohol dehydrogenase family)